MGAIYENVKRILADIPPQVQVVAAAKTRSTPEVREALEAGIGLIGQNYLQESRQIIADIGDQAQWHFIGHIQKNKVRQVVPLFDLIETVDSLDLARLIDSQAQNHGKIMPILIEINCAREAQKHGAMPEEAPDLITQVAALENIRVKGLMTMGPFLADPQGLRPYFRATRELFDEIRAAAIPRVDMQHLSMGMSDSYRIAIEEGATLVRIGTSIFGPRT